MMYLGIFYKDDGRVTIKEFASIYAIIIWWRQNANKYITYDIYVAKSINERIRMEKEYDKYIRNI